jgi:hypothetical protein
MLGEIPHCDTFNTMFNWQDAVVEIQADGSDVADVISMLADQPERLMEISRRNAVEAISVEENKQGTANQRGNSPGPPKIETV